MKLGELHKLYIQGETLRKLEEISGIDYRMIHYRLKKAGYETRQRPRKRVVEYGGVKFTACHSRGYWRRTDKDRELMHHFVWRRERGEIPRGMYVVHVDGDFANNKIENLELVPWEQRRKYQRRTNNRFTKGRSEAEIKADSENHCQTCGGRIAGSPSYIRDRKFCSTACFAAWKRGKPRTARANETERQALAWDKRHPWDKGIIISFVQLLGKINQKEEVG